MKLRYQSAFVLPFCLPGLCSASEFPPSQKMYEIFNQAGVEAAKKDPLSAEQKPMPVVIPSQLTAEQIERRRKLDELARANRAKQSAKPAGASATAGGIVK